MGFYRVRTGQMIGQNGKDFLGGDVIELSEGLAFELKDKVDPCLPDGTLLDQKIEAIPDAELANVREHERISVLQAHRDKCAAALEAAEKALADERARQEKPAPEKPSADAKDKAPSSSTAPKK